jgi:hypothetical protein
MRICWSDEATFELGYDGSVIWVTYAPGEEYLEKNLNLLSKVVRLLFQFGQHFVDGKWVL